MQNSPTGRILAFMLSRLIAVARGLLGFIVAYVAGKYLDGIFVSQADKAATQGQTRQPEIIISAPLWVFLVAAFVAVLFALWPYMRRMLRSGAVRNASTELRRALFGGISASLKAFQMVDALDLSHSEFEELEKIVWDGWSVYVVWFQLESHQNARRTRDWSFLVTNDRREAVPYKIVPQSWSSPKSWPKIDYSALDEVQNNYIQVGRIYNVKCLIAIESDGQRGKDGISLHIHFKDGWTTIVLEATPRNSADAASTPQLKRSQPLS